MYIIIYEVGACIDVSYTYKDRERDHTTSYVHMELICWDTVDACTDAHGIDMDYTTSICATHPRMQHH